MGNKNDVMDARAIWMTVQQPTKAVAVKTEEQQAVLSLHKMRRQLVQFRTAQINALHGLFLEFGEMVRKGRASTGQGDARGDRTSEGKRPPFLICQIEDQYRRLSDLDIQIEGIEKQLAAWVKQNEACQQLMDIPGVGPLVATAAVAIMGDAGAFRSGREFAAYIVLAPKQTGTGSKVRLLGISKHGDAYMRTLFIHGARAATLLAKDPNP